MTMTLIPIVEPFSKSTVSREAVEQLRLDRLTITGAVSSEITEDPDTWILTTIVRIDDGAAPPAVPPSGPNPQPSPRPPTHGPFPSPPGNGGSVFGVDSLSPAGRGKLATVTGALGVPAPGFWGRYFYAPHQVASGGNVDSNHYSPAENSFLRARGIRVLPIARQTGHVAGTAAQAVSDARQNVAAIFECFSPGYLASADPDVLVFLDVEEQVGQPVLTSQYYAAWSAEIERASAESSGGLVAMRPAIYTSRGARDSFLALKAAMAGGSHCFGVWTARGLSHGSPLAFSEAQMLPVVPLDCPTLLCQYFLSPDQAPPDENLDMSVCNPAHQDMLMSRLVMPPN